MADRYTTYAELAAAEMEGVDYLRSNVLVPRATWASIAIHGGAIEPGSGEMARRVGAGFMNHYEFAGIKPAGNTDLHITSIRFDEPTGVATTAASLRTLSFHGFHGEPRVAVTALGGRDAALRCRIGAALTAAGFAVTEALSGFSGEDPRNICNKNASSAGLQLEMSHAQRAAFFPGGDLRQPMRDSGRRTPAFFAYAAAILSVFDDARSPDQAPDQRAPASCASPRQVKCPDR